MPKRPGVRFRLRKSASSNLHSIVLHFLYFNRRLYFSTGQFIKSEDWDLKKERVRNKLKTTIDGNFALNDLLDNLEELCLKTFRVLMVDGIPEPIEIKNQLSKFFDKNHKNIEITKENSLFSLAQRFINGEIKNKGKEKSQGSLDNYHAVTEHLKAYKAYSKKRIDFDTIDLNFFYSYVDYLKKVKKLAENTIAKDISIIKVFMGEAVDLGYTDNFAFRNKKFTYSEVETDQIYLNEQELDRIYKHKFSNKKLENTRDLFI